MNYQEQNYRNPGRQQELEVFYRESDWLKNIPYKAMVKQGWIAHFADKALQLEAVLRFFGVASPASWNTMWGSSAPAFRQSPTLSSEPGALAAWLRKGELEAAKYPTEDFNSNIFRTGSCSHSISNQRAAT